MIVRRIDLILLDCTVPNGNVFTLKICKQAFPPDLTSGSETTVAGSTNFRDTTAGFEIQYVGLEYKF